MTNSSAILEKEERMANRLLLVASLEERLAAVEQMGNAKRVQPEGKW